MRREDVARGVELSTTTSARRDSMVLNEPYDSDRGIILNYVVSTSPTNPAYVMTKGNLMSLLTGCLNVRAVVADAYESPAWFWTFLIYIV